MKIGGAEVSPRAMILKIFEGKFASKGTRRLHHETGSARVSKPAERAGLIGWTMKGMRCLIHGGGSL